VSSCSVHKFLFNKSACRIAILRHDVRYFSVVLVLFTDTISDSVVLLPAMLQQ
jgi:hypothetical protein